MLLGSIGTNLTHINEIEKQLNNEGRLLVAAGAFSELTPELYSSL